MSHARRASTIALVGCGAWGSKVLRDLRALGSSVVVVAVSQESVARAREGGAAAVVASVDALPEVDGAVVATPATSHAEVCHALLDRGLSVFCEKPLTVDLEEARELQRGADGRLFVMDKWRYHGGVEALRDIVAGGELGRPVGLVALREQWGAPERDSDTIWVHVPHDLAIAFEVLGGFGEVRCAAAERAGSTPTGLHALLGDAPWVSISHSMAATETRRAVRLLCEEGSASLTGAYADALTVVRGAPVTGVEPERRAFDPEWPLPKELRAFLDHLAGGPPPRSSVDDHVALLEVLGAMRRAAGLDA